MFQLRFEFCPICGKAFTVFVDTDWLMENPTAEIPCEGCLNKLIEIEAFLQIVKLVGIDGIKDGSSNG
jgi:hypothetical protein